MNKKMENLHILRNFKLLLVFMCRSKIIMGNKNVLKWIVKILYVKTCSMQLEYYLPGNLNDFKCIQKEKKMKINELSMYLETLQKAK